jgi:PIN domain nuclease of toxin-antitoxin system
VSTASAWEVGLLSRPRPNRTQAPEFRPDPKAWFARFLRMPGVREIPGDFQPDPMDRLIVATARHLGLPVVTSDRRIIAYAQAGYVDVIAC